MAPQLRRLDRTAAQFLAELDTQVLKLIATPLLEEMKRDYASDAPVVAFIDEVGADMIDAHRCISHD